MPAQQSSLFGLNGIQDGGTVATSLAFADDVPLEFGDAPDVALVWDTANETNDAWKLALPGANARLIIGDRGRILGADTGLPAVIETTLSLLADSSDFARRLDIQAMDDGSVVFDAVSNVAMIWQVGAGAGGIFRLSGGQFQSAVGSASNPGISFVANTNRGLFAAGDNVSMAQNGVERTRWAETQLLHTETGSSKQTPSFGFIGDPDTGIFRQADNVLAVAIGAQEGARFAEPADGDTALLIRRNVGSVLTLQQVSMGAIDSGGAGFKLLRVPN